MSDDKRTENERGRDILVSCEYLSRAGVPDEALEPIRHYADGLIYGNEADVVYRMLKQYSRTNARKAMR